MSLQFDHLVGLPYQEGRFDCYGLVRLFYRDVFNIDLPNYARPSGWDGAGLDLLTKWYSHAGFVLLDVNASEYKPGDVFLIAIRSTTSNHAAVLVERGKILHHLYRNLSRVESYSGVWRNNTLAVLRHRDDPFHEEVSEVDALDLLSPRKRAQIERLVGSTNPRQ